MNKPLCRFANLAQAVKKPSTMATQAKLSRFFKPLSSSSSGASTESAKRPAPVSTPTKESDDVEPPLKRLRRAVVGDEAEEATKAAPAARASDVGLKESLEGMQYDEGKHRSFLKKLTRVREEEAAAAADSGVASGARAPAVGKLTPLEQQVVELKRQHPDVLMMFEVGYKMRLFGKDAEVASEVLRIFAYPDHSFLTAMVPVTRLDFHVRRLVHAGHKVGVVRQTEVAAVRNLSDAKGKTFARSLSAIYTPATLVGSDIDPIDAEQGAPPAYLMCLCEEGILDSVSSSVGAGPVSWSFVAVNLAVGEVLFESMEDDSSRSRLETVLAHLMPAEIVLPAAASTPTTKLAERQRKLTGCVLWQVEDSAVFDTQASSKLVQNFFTSHEKAPLAEKIVLLGEGVVRCLGALLSHLKKFSLEKTLLLIPDAGPTKWSVAAQMKLPCQTVRNLELLQNQTDFTEKGSLLWVVGNTSTAFGRRMMRSWVLAPLTDKTRIDERLDAVEEIFKASLREDGGSSSLAALRTLLHSLSDLEKGLVHVHSRKCSPKEFVTLMTSFARVAAVQVDPESVRSPLIRSVMEELPGIAELCHACLDAVNPKSEAATATGNTTPSKVGLFTDFSGFPDVASSQQEVEEIEEEMKTRLAEAREEVGISNLEFTHMSKEEYLLELPNAKKKGARAPPEDWVKVNHTQSVTRWRTPAIIESLAKLGRARALREAALDAAWVEFLSMVSDEHYTSLRAVTRQLAVLDCLFSLAKVASRPGYVRPAIHPRVAGAKQVLEIVDGRNPVVEALITDSYVPNTVRLASDETRCMVVTGPNMGGKTCLIRQVALCVLLAQIGSFVPASRMEVTPFDGIFTRMGAADNIDRGQSTFFVELSETSQILHETTSNSLVLLDELGRGTSTHDGMAIAYGTLFHMLESSRPLVLFVTHFSLLAETMEAIFPGAVVNRHMSVLDDGSSRSSLQNVTFLYKLTNGLAPRSHGLNAARLAGVPASVLEEAESLSTQLEKKVAQERPGASPSRILQSLAALLKDDPVPERLLRECWFSARQSSSVCPQPN